MKTKSVCVALLLLATSGAWAGGFLGRLLSTTLNRLVITILPPGKSNPSNMSLVDGDMMCVSMMDQPAARQIHAAEAHEVATGKGVVVAVLDGGFDLGHAVLSGKLTAARADTLDGGSDPNDLGDGYDNYGEGTPDNAVGHGNFVAGMVLLSAPDARIMPIRVMDDEGYGNNGSIANGLRFAVRNGARVVNISAQAALLGQADVRNALDEAYARGVVVVASAGNEGRSDLGVIASDSRSVSVGAVDSRNVVAPFSNTAGWGEQLAVFAPGVDLEGPLTRGEMGVWSGTSFSAGLTSGAVALWLQLEPTSSPSKTLARMKACVNPAFDRNGRRCAAGVVDLMKVVSR